MLSILLLALGQSPAESPAGRPANREVEDTRARQAFLALAPAARREVLELSTLQFEHAGTFQASLVAWVRRNQDRDRSEWPVLRPAAWYDPEVLAPAQPTPRVALDPHSKGAEDARKSIFARRATRGWTPGWAYDWATGSLVRIESADEPRRVFENFLLGFGPDVDLAEALVERALDDRSRAREAAAFGHAYTDRAGHVYPGITLYDAYSSGTDFEMPDVDVLGLLQDLFGGAGGVTAPIPSTQHAGLYARIGEAFLPLQRHRELRTALARTYVVGDAVLDGGYGGQLDNFHALWEDCASTPETLAARLPAPEDRDAFLESWTKRCLGPDSPYPAGQRRHATLAADALVARACLLDALKELGALRSAPTATGLVR